MIIKYIHHYAGIVMVVRLKPSLACDYFRMGICIVVNGTVQFNALPDTGSVVVKVTPLYEIADEITNHDFRCGTGQVKMRQEVHKTVIQKRRRAGSFSALNYRNDYPTSKPQFCKMSVIAQLKTLINLARIDGEVESREKQYIINIGKANGCIERDIIPLFDQSHDVIIPSGLAPEQKFDYLLSLVRLMKIDERIYKEELHYCATVASKLGYEQEVLFDLMLHARSGTMSQEEIAELRELTRKHLS
jgi:hypothetical protein